MELSLVGAEGKGAGGSVELHDAAFAAEYNEPLVHQVVTAFMAGARSGTKAQKTRAAVSGGGRKPWRQKGTGHARAGSIRSPLWRGGGVTFAASPRDYSQKLNRKMYRGAMRSIVSELVRRERILVVEAFELEAPKTRVLAARLSAMDLRDVLILVEREDPVLELAARNLHWVAVLPADQANPVSLLAFEKILATVGALKKLEERLA